MSFWVARGIVRDSFESGTLGYLGLTEQMTCKRDGRYGGAKKNWSREETLAALFLYLALPARLIDDKGEDVQTLARAIGRTPAAVSLKIWNLASFDERRRARGKVGMVNASKMDKMVWAEYSSGGDELIEEAADAFFGQLDQLDSGDVMSDDLQDAIGASLPEGRDRDVIISTRVNQQFFRNTLLVNYNSHCCLTGLSNQKLLVASHIKPWKASDPKTERLAPDNGLLLNALHDRAFDQGLITITKDLKIIVSSMVRHEAPEDEYLWRYNGERITLPKQSSPRAEFIEYHNDMVFKG